ncbi:MAG TPA: hypothetical protein VEC11_08090 [Allosphingosinicella sp.]|nr:hypothetical protein [Allosphingosinicella sp.]
MTWGVADKVRERFGAAGIPAGRISCLPDTWVFRHDGPPAQFLDIFRLYYGPTMNAYAAAEASGRAADLHAELTLLFEAQNRAGPDRTEIPATYLRVTVER